jgi:catechol 2,3-dioxygenase-like lactoylglutathione lyase family enzyme
MSSMSPERRKRMTTKTLTRVLTVAIPVTDQDRTKSFLQDLGLEERLDRELQPGFRWIELAAAGGDTTVSLVKAGDDLPAGIDTGVRLATPDARAAHARMTELGLQVGELLDWETAPLMFAFRDFDGNRFYVTQVDD